MNHGTRSLLPMLLGLISCFVVLAFAAVPLAIQAEPLDPATVPSSLASYLQSNLEEAESIVTSEGSPKNSAQRYAAILLGDQVVPTPASTMATGVAGAVLSGNRLIVRGDFGMLSSQLRDFAADPTVPPNPNVTSAVHIHRGEPNQNGPFQYALTVTLNGDRLSGRVAGAYTLTPEQLQALSDGKLYVDLHTRQNRVGELRGIIRPLRS